MILFYIYLIFAITCLVIFYLAEDREDWTNSDVITAIIISVIPVFNIVTIIWISSEWLKQTGWLDKKPFAKKEQDDSTNM